MNHFLSNFIYNLRYDLVGFPTDTSSPIFTLTFHEFALHDEITQNYIRTHIQHVKQLYIFMTNSMIKTKLLEINDMFKQNE